MLNPGQAEPGGLGNLIAQQPSQGATPTGINPMMPQMAPLDGGQLLRMIEQNMQQNNSTPIAALAEISRRLTQAKNAKMEEGRRAAAMLAGQPATIKDELVQQALMAGIGSQPYEFAGGGLVAFENGGMTTQEPPLTTEDIDTAGLGDRMAFGVDPQFYLGEPVETKESFLDRIIREARERIREARERRQREEEARNEAWLRENAPVAVENRDAPPKLATDFERPPYERRGVVPAAGAGVVPAAGAGVVPAAGAGAGAGAGARPAPPDPTAAAIAEYLKQGQEAITGMEGRGKVPAGELELRKALLAAQEAERQAPMEYQQPRGLTGREMLQLASFDPTKGRWVQSLAERAAGVASAREARAEEAKKTNREIDVANRRLNTALAQQRLAYASGDRKAQEDADLAVANARVALREKVVQLGFESRKVGAQERQARAAEIAASQRGEATETKAEADRANRIRTAISDAQKRNPIPPGLPANAQRPIIQRQIEDVVAQVAPLGVSREQVLQYFRAAGLAGAGTDTSGWGQPTVVPKP